MGTRTNRAGIGAKIRVDVTSPSGQPRSIFRQVGGTTSYGGSSLVELVGLGDSPSVDAITVTWPVSRTSQTFRQIAADQTVEVREGSEIPRFLKRSPAIGPPSRPLDTASKRP